MEKISVVFNSNHKKYTPSMDKAKELLLKIKELGLVGRVKADGIEITIEKLVSRL